MDVLEFFFGEIAGLLGGLPEEVFKQLPRFDREGFGEILGIVKLRPVALVPECEDLLLDGFQVGHHPPKEGKWFE